MQDLHIHTTFSDGQESVGAIFEKSQKLGVEFGISDHILCKKLVNKDDILNYFTYLSEYPVLAGCEIDLGQTGIIDDYITSKADYIIGSIHNVEIDGEYIRLGAYFDYRSKKKLLSTKYIYSDYFCCKALEKILKTINYETLHNPIDILGHCTVTPFFQQVNEKFKFEWENELISICKSNKVALEISGLWVEPGIDLIARAINNGVKVTFGSDCHTQYSQEYFEYFIYAAKTIGIKKEDVLKIVKK